MEALREAVLNAVVHKDYTRGAPIQISVYADKLMIWNPARLPPTWTLERLLAKHTSDPFNPDMANTFFRMVQTCLDAGMGAPVLKVEADGVWVTFEFLPPVVPASIKTQVKTPVKTPVKRFPSTKLRTPQKIVAALEVNPQLTLAELAGAMDKSLSAMERATAKLVKEGKLRFVGPKKGGRWEVLK
jgi:ATP-dependent DNA helicase RecG